MSRFIRILLAFSLLGQFVGSTLRKVRKSGIWWLFQPDYYFCSYMMLDDDFEVLKYLSGLTLSNAQDLRLVVLALQQ